MKPPLLFRIQESKVDGLESSYEAWKKDHDGAMLAFDLEVLVGAGKRLAEESSDWWQETWDLLNHDGQTDLDFLGRNLDKIMGKTGRLLQVLADSVRASSAQTGQPVAGLDQLERQTEELFSRHQRAMQHWPWQDEAWPPLNRPMQQRARQEVEAGLGEDAEAIRRRLQAGGLLVGE